MAVAFENDFHGVHTLNRMEPAFRNTMQSFLDHWEKTRHISKQRGVPCKIDANLRDVLTHAEKKLRTRANGPMRYDPLYRHPLYDRERAERKRLEWETTIHQVINDHVMK